MLTLLLMRHAKSSWDDSQLSDHDRPLNARGLRSAPRMGRLLREQGLVPQLIVTSTARRAMDTAHAIVTAVGYDGRIEVTRRLYLAEPEVYLEVLSELEPRHGRVLVIGHNPGIAQLVEQLTGVAEEMPTAAIAQVELDVADVSEIAVRSPEPTGRLRAVFRPKELD
jgi:phosphohistidine phosphatase